MTLNAATSSKEVTAWLREVVDAMQQSLCNARLILGALCTMAVRDFFAEPGGAGTAILDEMFPPDGKGRTAKGEDASRRILAYAGLAHHYEFGGPDLRDAMKDLSEECDTLFPEALPEVLSDFKGNTLAELRKPQGTRLATNLRNALALTPMRVLRLVERIITTELALAAAPPLSAAARRRLVRGAAAALLDPKDGRIWEDQAWEPGDAGGIMPPLKQRLVEAQVNALAAACSSLRSLRVVLERTVRVGTADRCVLDFLREGGVLVDVESPKRAQEAAKEVADEAAAADGDSGGEGAGEDVEEDGDYAEEMPAEEAEPLPAGEEGGAAEQETEAVEALSRGERGLKLLVVTAPAQQLILAGALLLHGSA